MARLTLAMVAVEDEVVAETMGLTVVLVTQVQTGTLALKVVMEAGITMVALERLAMTGSNGSQGANGTGATAGNPGNPGNPGGVGNDGTGATSGGAGGAAPSTWAGKAGSPGSAGAPGATTAYADQVIRITQAQQAIALTVASGTEMTITFERQ